MLPFADALQRIIESAPVMASERVELAQGVGRVLAEDLMARAPLCPASTTAPWTAMPSRAARLRAPGLGRCPCRGRAARARSQHRWSAAARVEFLTGAPIPEAADAVVMQEEVTREGDRAGFAVVPALGRPHSSAR